MNTIQQHNTSCPICFSVFEVVYDDDDTITDYRCANPDCPNGRMIAEQAELASQEMSEGRE